MKLKPIVIVSGLPRSGTSMLMQMLRAGGLGLLTDGLRRADEDNPRGYFELEAVKDRQDLSWLEGASGKAVKVISALLEFLPPDYHYRVLFIRRPLKEILASQREMLLRKGQAPEAEKDQSLAKSFQSHLKEVNRWLDQQPNFKTLYLDYRQIIQAPLKQVMKINRFLGEDLDVKKMAAVVDQRLYHQRL
jgi:hypothetical protein